MRDPTCEQVAKAIHAWDVEGGPCEGPWDALNGQQQHVWLSAADVVMALFAPALKAARAEGWEEGFGAGWAAQDPDDHEPNPYHQTGEGQ